MGVLQFPSPIPVTNGNYPQLKFGVFTDNLTTVTTAGYLNQSSIEAGMPLSNADVILALYGFSTSTFTGTFGIFTVNIAASTGQITLTSWADPGNAVLPTTANYLAHFTNTTGTISSAAANVINPGNIQAGLSGTAGTVSSFPATASKGSLQLVAVANTGNTATIISNAAMGQASTISIPDPGASTANFLLSAVASGPQTMAGGLTISSGNLAVSAGNVTAGSSGNAGTVSSFPGTASRGSLILAAVNNTGNTTTTISNAAMGQASVVSIPDPGAATANFLLDHGTNTLASGSSIVANKVPGTESANAVTASGMAGLITTSSLTTAGGSNYAITWTNTFISSTSVVLLTLAGGTNTTNNITLKVVPGSGTATLTIYNNTAATALNGTILISYLVI